MADLRRWIRGAEGRAAWLGRTGRRARQGRTARRGWRVISTERRTKRPGWIAADLSCDLPFRDAQFDLVMMLEVIEHLADIPHALGEIARVRQPGVPAVGRP